MREVSEEEKAMYIYSLHVVLYANDMATYAIKDLKKFMPEKDKETQKIFGALMKRVRKYDRDLLSKLGDTDMYFYADFNSFFDSYFDNDLEGLRRSAEWIFRCNGYKDTLYLSKIETAYALVCFSVSIAASYITGLRQNGARTFSLPSYKLDEIKTIFENLYDWTIKLQHKPKILDLSKYKSVSKYFERIKKTMVDRKIFEDAYAFALREEEERNKK